MRIVSSDVTGFSQKYSKSPASQIDYRDKKPDYNDILFDRDLKYVICA
jgi:hypothetical protein